jgi:uncharacterized protein
MTTAIDLAYELKVSDDGLAAELTIPRGAGPVPELSDFVAHLEEVEHLVAVDEVKVAHLLSLAGVGRKAGPEVIARGIEPITGKDAQLEWRGDFFDRVPLERPDGSVDHFRRNKTSVAANAIIAEWIPPEAGTPGRTVRGEEIEAEAGRPWRPTLHPTVAWTDEAKTQIEALVSGQVEFARGRLSISQVFAVKSVDFSSSSIDFDGAVDVSGDVREGFEVRATGTVTVSGFVETAIVTSGGNLAVKQGIIGRNKIRIECAGDMEVGFARELEIVCGGQLLSNGELLFCTGRIGGDVTASKNRLVGGHWQIGGSLYVSELGSESETPTVVNVGIDADLEAKQAEQAAEREKLQQEIEDRALQIENLERKRARTDKEEIALQKLKVYLGQLRKQDRVAAEQDRLMRQRIKMQKRYGTIWVIEGMYPGVKVWAGGKPQPLEVTKYTKGPLRIGYLPGRNQPAVTHGGNQKFESLF